MKIPLFMTLLLLLVIAYNPLKFRDVVRVKDGFYAGCTGNAMDVSVFTTRVQIVECKGQRELEYVSFIFMQLERVK